MDDLPLVHAFTQKSDARNNSVGDTLSRITLAVIHLELDYKTLAEGQRKDPEDQSCRSSNTSLLWEDVPHDNSNATLFCDVSTGRPEPWIPSLIHRHAIPHSLCRSTAQLLKTKIIWHGIIRKAEDWVRICTSYQTSKVYEHMESGVDTFPKPHRCFAHIHIILVGLLPTLQGRHYLFSIIHHSNHWPEVIPI
ncbi:uncharacterized protein [Palaemon carinicauda]|uniref:uncharacterized protein n=1 Tax=Palaemon carinicauda TaxID=392227 RepID=UPI0035B570FE